MSKSRKKVQTESLYDTALVAKQNVLNEMRSNHMTLQELRFFSIYLSKINPRDESSRIVRFPLSDFQKIMEFGRINNINRIKATTNSLLSKVINIPNERGGYTGFQLFSDCTVDKDEYNQWYIEINANDKALPLFFEFKEKYFTYALWNALRLKSSNQIRMYEILKQYEKLGKRELFVTELREMLGIGKEEYSRWNNFKAKVLDECQQALAKTTDICYTYERGQTGRGGKWITIIFYISKNEEYIDPLTLDEFIEQQPEPLSPVDSDQSATEDKLLGQLDFDEITVDTVDDVDLKISQYGSENLAILASGCDYEFDREQMEQISIILTRIDVPEDYYGGLIWGKQKYLREKHAALGVAAKQTKIKNRFKYFLSMIEKDASRPVAFQAKNGQFDF